MIRKAICILFHRWYRDKDGKPGAYCPKCNLVWTWGNCKEKNADK
jgi:hypothetical protein